MSSIWKNDKPTQCITYHTVANHSLHFVDPVIGVSIINIEILKPSEEGDQTHEGMSQTSTSVVYR